MDIKITLFMKKCRVWGFGTCKNSLNHFLNKGCIVCVMYNFGLLNLLEPSGYFVHHKV